MSLELQMGKAKKGRSSKRKRNAKSKELIESETRQKLKALNIDLNLAIKGV